MASDPHARSAGPRPTVRRVPQQARGQQTVHAVLRAAGQEIARAGIDKLSTKRIAEAAGLSVGGLYGYFPNKEAIVAALLESWHERLFEAIDSVHPRHGAFADLFSYLYEQADRAIGVYVEQPGLAALFNTATAMPFLQDIILRHAERVAASLRSGLQHLVPGAPADRVDIVARSIPLICHPLAVVASAAPPADQARTHRVMRLCLTALGTDLIAAF